MSGSKILKISKACAVKLKRSIISISGKDSANVLQGITTNNITQFASDPIQQSIFCGFLNSQGRLVSDAIIIKPQKSLNDSWENAPNEYWIDSPQDTAEDLFTHIKHYLFRKKVTLDNIGSQLNAWAVYSPGQKDIINEGQPIPLQTEELPDDDGLYKSLCFADPRSRYLGARTLTNTTIDFNNDVVEVSLEDYRFFRLAHGILEGKEVQGKIPFLVNLDLLNGINFNKGCYVGQELTARSYHTGIVRKRCFSFIVGENLDRDPLCTNQFVGELVKNSQDEVIGKVLAQQNNLCVSSINYIDYELKNLKIGDQPIKIIINKQVQEKLNEYKELIKKRM